QGPRRNGLDLPDAVAARGQNRGRQGCEPPLPEPDLHRGARRPRPGRVPRDRLRSRGVRGRAGLPRPPARPMEQLRVLVGEPLLVIDFRYHLVSLIAVFLAVALGIIIGTPALNEPIQADIEGQVTDLEQDKRALEDRPQQLQTQVDAADSFADAVAPVLVNGALKGRSVLLVVTNE